MNRLISNINEIHLEVTPECNLKCKYCFIGDLKLATEKRLLMSSTYEKALAWIFENSKHDNLLLTFHGGEPLLRSSSWFDDTCNNILDISANFNKHLKLSLQTNGALISNDFINVFSKYNIKVGVSLDGLKEEHDRLRGCFERIFENILLLKVSGLLGGIIMVVTKINYQRIDKFFSHLFSNNIKNISANVFHVNGRGTQDLVLSVEEILFSWKTIISFMINHKGFKERNMLYKLLHYFNPPSKREYKLKLNCNNPFCHAGIKMLHISYDGNFYPCGTSSWIGENEYKLGNIHSEIDKKIWEQKVIKLHEKDIKYHAECRYCEAYSICDFSCSAFDKNDHITKQNICAATKKLKSYLDNTDHNCLRELTNAKSQHNIDI